MFQWAELSIDKHNFFYYNIGSKQKRLTVLKKLIQSIQRPGKLSGLKKLRSLRVKAVTKVNKKALYILELKKQSSIYKNGTITKAVER